MELKVVLKMNRYEHEVVHLDYTVTLITRLFNWQAISVHHKLDNTEVSAVIKLAICESENNQNARRNNDLSMQQAPNFAYHYKIRLRVCGHISYAPSIKRNQDSGQIYIAIYIERCDILL